MSKDNKRNAARKARAARKAAAPNRADGAADDSILDPPYGYDRDAEGELVANEQEAEVIERIRALGEKRLSIGAIATKLNTEDLTVRGAAWDAKTVSRLLRRKVTKYAAGAKRSV